MHLAAPRLLEPQFFGHERNFLSHSHSGFPDSASVWDCEGRIKFQSPRTNFHRLQNRASAHINREDCETNGELLYQKEYGNQSNERENDCRTDPMALAGLFAESPPGARWTGCCTSQCNTARLRSRSFLKSCSGRKNLSEVGVCHGKDGWQADTSRHLVCCPRNS